MLANRLMPPINKKTANTQSICKMWLDVVEICKSSAWKQSLPRISKGLYGALRSSKGLYPAFTHSKHFCLQSNQKDGSQAPVACSRQLGRLLGIRSPGAFGHPEIRRRFFSVFVDISVFYALFVFRLINCIRFINCTSRSQ